MGKLIINKHVIVLTLHDSVLILIQQLNPRSDSSLTAGKVLP